MRLEYIDNLFKITFSEVPTEDDIDRLVAMALRTDERFVVYAAETTTLRPPLRLIEHLRVHLNAHIVISWQPQSTAIAWMQSQRGSSPWRSSFTIP